jgi:hypothetical protein
MKLPIPAELTDADRESVAKITRQVDGLAASILGAPLPDAAEHTALAGLVAFGRGTNLFTPTPWHVAALGRLPAPAPILRGDRILPPLAP